VNRHGGIALSLNDVGLAYVRRSGLLKKKLFWSLRDISLDVQFGETLGVIGANGCGKSTLLRLMANIIAPDQGSVTLHHGASASLLALQLGFIPYLTGRENAILSGILIGLSKQEVKHKMGDIIAFSELGEFIDQPICSYSAGMKARLGFSVAFNSDPDIILIDEVLGVGDEAFRQKSLHAMQDRIRSDKTVVIVSHALPMMSRICTRGVWIENGRIAKEGNIDEVIDSYKKRLSSHEVK